jgi:hypothetical protein
MDLEINNGRLSPKRNVHVENLDFNPGLDLDSKKDISCNTSSVYHDARSMLLVDIERLFSPQSSGQSTFWPPPPRVSESDADTVTETSTIGSTPFDV